MSGGSSKSPSKKKLAEKKKNEEENSAAQPKAEPFYSNMNETGDQIDGSSFTSDNEPILPANIL